MLSYIVLRVVVLLYFLVVAGTIVVVILEKRQPVKTMAWVLVLIALPVVGIILFYFFGQDVRKERMLQRREIDLLNRKTLSRYLPLETVSVPVQYRALSYFFLEQIYAPPFSRNDITLYSSGFDKITALIRDIARAKHYIHMEYFIFENDALGRLVRDCLIDAVRRGVEVRFMYDDVGCWSVKQRFYDEMAAAGVIVRGFMPVRFARFARRVNYRNHRKIAVIDGVMGYVGGMNIALRYLYGYKGEGWRDMHLRLRGSAVYGLQQVFITDWFFNNGEKLEGSCYYPPVPDDVEGRAMVQVVSASPASKWPNIMNGFVWAILNAKRYFYLATPYFMPTEQVLNALQMAAASGVDVRLMLPARADNRLTHLASCSYLADVLQAGVKIYLYQKGFLHSKLMVSDDHLSTVGSTNVDFRSFEHNFEVNAFIYDMETALQMREIFLQDQRDCQQISLKTWEKRPRRQKAAESVVRLLSPLL